jgi:glycine/D-amino acid oxidase-like deaminating enzyme
LTDTNANGEQHVETPATPVSGPVIVIGAGIVGLTTAIALRRAGLDVVVAEQAPEIRAAGASLGLWANALAVFDELGLGREIRASHPGMPGPRRWPGPAISTTGGWGSLISRPTRPTASRATRRPGPPRPPWRTPPHRVSSPASTPPSPAG